MHLFKVDLNLFVVLDAICAEGSITRAADRLHLTQPAVSHALARLRDVYADPLFVRSGNGVAPTALTKRLIGPIRESLLMLQETLQPSQPFDAAGARNSFVVALPDVLETWVLPPLMQYLQEVAPRMQMASVRARRRELDADLAGGRLDLAFDVLMPVAPALRHAPLMEDRFVVVAREGHPILAADWTMDAYCQFRHIVVSSRRTGLSAEDFELSRLGLRRDIALRCSNYHVAWKTMEQTDLLLTVPEQYALMREAGPFSVKPMPMDVRGLAIQMYWHESVDQDPANQWLRSVFKQVLARDQRPVLRKQPAR